MDQTEAKRLAAARALELLPDRGTIGLGSGSTARFFIEGVGQRVRAGAKLVGVPTSRASRELAESLGIPLAQDSGPWSIDVCVDGADEVSTALDLIKGGGAALTREKIVNQAAELNVIVVDESKLSQRLGEHYRLPVEVMEFGHQSTSLALARHGICELRRSGAELVRTDSGQLIYDVTTGPIDDPAELERSLLGIPGVIEVGLFIGRADVVIVAGDAGVRELRR